MIFDEWLVQRNLAPSSADKYAAAITVTVSNLAINANLLQCPLASITSQARFDEIADQIRALPAFLELNHRGHNMYTTALNHYSHFLAESFQTDLESEVGSILADPHLSETDKKALVNVRIGQGVFREQLLGYWGQCAVSGYRNPRLLVASHIKPWRWSNPVERLDPFNGLLLVPTIDRAFDAGLITFVENGSIKISPRLENPGVLGISQMLRVALNAKHEPYMSYHRSEVYHPA